MRKTTFYVLDFSRNDLNLLGLPIYEISRNPFIINRSDQKAFSIFFLTFQSDGENGKFTKNICALDVLFNRLSCFRFAISNAFSRFLLSMRCVWNGIQHIQLCLLSNWKFRAWMQCTNVHSWSDTENLSDDYL